MGKLGEWGWVNGGRVGVNGGGLAGRGEGVVNHKPPPPKSTNK